MKKQLEAIILIIVLLVAAGALYFIFKQGGIKTGQATYAECVASCQNQYKTAQPDFKKELIDLCIEAHCKSQQPPQQPPQGGGTAAGGPGTIVIAGSSGGSGTTAQSPPPCREPCDDGNPDTCEDACDASGKCVGKGGAILCGDADCGYSQKKCVGGKYSETPACDCKSEGGKCGFTLGKACHGCNCVEMTPEETEAEMSKFLTDTCRTCSEKDPTFFDKCLDLAGKGAKIYGYIGSPTPHFDKDMKCDGVSVSWTIPLGKSKK
jgi:hypothetical protein